MTASERILTRLSEAPYPLALFELNIMGVSENAAATRLSELQAQGKVIGVIRKNTRYKEWSINNSDFKGSGRGQGCVSSPSKPIHVVWGADGQADWIQEAMG